MSEPVISSGTAAVLPQLETSQTAIRQVATIAWLAIILGLAMQLMILAAKLFGGAQFPGLRLFVDLAQGITWSLLVCTGVGIGAAVSKARASMMGIMGLISAPIAIAAAKASGKAVETLVEKFGEPGALPLATISGIKAAEYGALGWLLGRMIQKKEGRFLLYAATGLGVGLVFGGGTLFLSYQAALQKGAGFPLPQLFGSAVNEIVFPVGCAVVIYIGQFLGRHLSVIEAARQPASTA